jgi:phospholipid/cholesterol/gamma-HCH transport system ATP-binding protein
MVAVMKEDLSALIEVRHLSKRFGNQVVFEELNLDVYEGEVLGIVGQSGGGKSVLLRCLNGLERVDGGEIRFFGDDVAKMSGRAMRHVEASSGILFQDGALFSALTVLQNIQVPMREHISLPNNIMDELAYLKLSLVGLPANAAHKYPSELSGGMRKRAGLARALALDPKILFLDEPTAGLDPIGASEFDKLIGDLQATLGLTVFMVTHDLDSIFAICDRVAVLADRHIVRTGSPFEMARDPQHPWIKAYFCGARARAVLHGDGTTMEDDAEIRPQHPI